MNDIIGSWLAEQERRQRALFLILDRQAESQLPVSLPTTLLASRINLYRDSEAASLAELGPWLIGVPDPHADWLLAWLEQAEHHWGWLASAGRADPVPLLRHWRERILIREQGRRTLYRFQDNRVIARHLAALEPATQRPLLLGPICSCLAWDGQQWRVFDNPNPGSHAPGNAPWLSVPEPEAIQTAIRRHNLEHGCGKSIARRSVACCTSRISPPGWTTSWPAPGSGAGSTRTASSFSWPTSCNPAWPNTPPGCPATAKPRPSTWPAAATSSSIRRSSHDPARPVPGPADPSS